MIKNKKLIKRIYNVVIIAIMLVALGWIVSRFWHPGNVVYTDDAQVHRHINPINTRVQGFIKEIRFEEFQHVKKGDTLVIIEDAEFQLRLAQARAGVRGSQSGSQAVAAGMTTTSSNVNVANEGARAAVADVDGARIAMDNARKDLDRYDALLAKGSVTQQQYDAIKAQYDGAKSRWEAAQARQSQATAATRATAVVRNEQAQRLNQSNAGVSVAQAQVNLAQLNLSYTVIVASCDGIVTRKNIHEGQLVQPGQLLLTIVDDSEVWVTANYRETQMKHITVGNKVEFSADAIDGVTFHGVVQSISGATGSALSGVQVDNATGNFVKVEQRVPVRITLTNDNDPKAVARLLAGLNVETKVLY